MGSAREWDGEGSDRIGSGRGWEWGKRGMAVTAMVRMRGDGKIK